MRAPRSKYREIDWSATRDSYHAEEYGLETRIDDRERNNSASPLDLDETGTETLVDMILNNREKRIASLRAAVAVANSFQAGLADRVGVTEFSWTALADLIVRTFAPPEPAKFDLTGIPGGLWR